MLLLLSAGVVQPLSAQDRVSDQKKAQTALQDEVKQIGKDCPNTETTIEINSCIAEVERKTKLHFEAFYESLRSLLVLGSEAANQLDSSQAQWEKYRKQACDAIDSFYSGGTIRLSAATSCEIQLMRSRMQDLDVLYSSVLHN